MDRVFIENRQHKCSAKTKSKYQDWSVCFDIQTKTTSKACIHFVKSSLRIIIAYSFDALIELTIFLTKYASSTLNYDPKLKTIPSAKVYVL